MFWPDDQVMAKSLETVPAQKKDVGFFKRGETFLKLPWWVKKKIPTGSASSDIGY